MRVRLLGRAGQRLFTESAANPSAPKNKVGYSPGDLVPSLAGLIPKVPANQKKQASEMPWVKSSESFFQMWEKVKPCMPKYEAFLQTHTGHGLGGSDLKGGKGFKRDLSETREALGGKAMGEKPMAALAEFYLCMAFKLRPEEIAAAGSDSTALLKVARRCAEEDFEPFVDSARELISDYDMSMHMALEETSPFYEVDEGLFWRANFDVAAPAELQHFLTALGHSSGYRGVQEQAYTSKEKVAQLTEKVQEGLAGDDASLEPARRAATMAYDKWLEASSMPVKAVIAKTLMEHGLLVSVDVHDSNKLLPEVYEVAAKLRAA